MWKNMVNALAKLKLKTEFILNARKTVAEDGRFSGKFLFRASIWLAESVIFEHQLEKFAKMKI